jgi:hypothetical protein
LLPTASVDVLFLSVMESISIIVSDAVFYRGW